MEQADNPKLYGPVITVIITVAIFFASQLAAAILISILPLIWHWNTAQTSTWVQNNVWATFAFVAFVEAVTLCLLRISLNKRKISFRSLGLDKAHLKYVGFALAGFASYLAIYIVGIIVIKSLVPSLNLDQKQEIGFNTTTHGVSLLPVFVSLVILPPITEEIVARGFLFGGLRTKLPFVTSAIITSTLFAAAHLGEASKGLLWVAAIDTFILSLVLCYLREKTASLWPSIGVHMLKNALAFVVLFNLIQYLK